MKKITGSFAIDGETNWKAVRAFFITQTSANSDVDSLNSVARRFNVSNAALSRMAGKIDANGKTWWDYRAEFVERKLIDDNADKIKDLVKSVEKTKNILSGMKTVVSIEFLEAMKDPVKRKRFYEKLKMKDIVSLLNVEAAITDKLIDYNKQGLNRKGTKIILSIDKPLEEMSPEEIDEFISKAESFDFEDTEFKVLED